MPAPTTSQEFLELVRKSTLLEEKKLDSYLDKLRGNSGVPSAPGDLANVLVRDAMLTFFQAEQFMLGKWRRFNIGRYRVLERLGSGGMGQVFLCEHIHMRRRVAVKVLPTQKADDPASLERFYREARCVAALDHPNLVRAFDIDQDEKLHFLVMEYVDGSSLQEIVKKSGPLDPVRAAHYLAQAAEGVQHAFEFANLVHRDIKPANILVDRNGDVKILDMGLARFFNDEEDVLTRKYEENVLGTADYLAPEQAQDSHTVDIRADIYSLGTTFYFCLTGRTPFAEGTVAQKLVWHQTRQPKPISTFRSDIPAELLHIIEKTMEKNPANRYQTPIEVAQALQPWVQIPISPPSEAEMPRLSPAVMGQLGGTTETRTISSGPGSSTKRSWSIPGSGSMPRRSTTTPPSGSGKSLPPPTPKSGKALPANNPRETHRVPIPPPPVPGGKRTAANGVATSNGKAAAMSAAEELVALSQDRTEPRSSPNTSRTVESKTAGKSEVSEQEGGLGLWRIFLVVGVIALVSAAAIVGMLLLGGCSGNQPSGSQSHEEKKPEPPKPRIVSKTEPGAYPTILAAIKKAPEGTRIQVKDDVIEGQLRLATNNEFKVEWDEPVIVEAAGEKPVVWRAQVGAKSSDPLLYLSGVKGVHFKGFDFNGEGRTEEGVWFLSYCPGVVLEDISFRDFTRSAIHTYSSAGLRKRPIEFRNLKVSTQQAKGNVGFHFNIINNIPDVPRTEFFNVKGCRFDGPFVSAVKTTGFVGELTWEDNVWKSGDGSQPVPKPE